jgi:hypothetical protein
VTKSISNEAAKKVMMTKFDSKQIIMDSGAEVTVLHEEIDGMGITNDNPKVSLVYGNNQTSKVQKLGNMGKMKDVHISSDISDNVLSISQLTDLGYSVLTTDKNMYVIRPDITFDLKRSSLMLTAKRNGGLYKAQLNKLSKLLITEKESNESSESEEEDSSNDDETESEEELRKSTKSGK